MVLVKNKFIKKLITNYIFLYLFDVPLYKKGDVLITSCGVIYELDDSNGNIGSLKYFFKLNGFWNYFSAKNDIGVDIHNSKVKNLSNYSGMYKNYSYPASNEEIELYNNIIKNLK